MPLEIYPTDENNKERRIERKEKEKLKISLENYHVDNIKWLKENKFDDGLAGHYTGDNERLNNEYGKYKEFHRRAVISYKKIPNKSFGYHVYVFLYADNTLGAMMTDNSLDFRKFYPRSELLDVGKKHSKKIKESLRAPLRDIGREVRKHTGAYVEHELNLIMEHNNRSELMVPRADIPASEAVGKLDNIHFWLAVNNILLTDDSGRCVLDKTNFGGIFKNGRWLRPEKNAPER